MLHLLANVDGCLAFNFMQRLAIHSQSTSFDTAFTSQFGVNYF
jgi:hypothetical protein